MRKKLMAKTVIALLVCTLQVQAAAFSQQIRIDIALKHVTVSEVFRYLEGVSACRFVYDSDAVDRLERVTVKMKEAELGQVLDAVLRGSGMGYVMEDGVVIIRRESREGKAPETAAPQAQQIRGVVTDKEGNPLPGVTVLLKGTTVGVVSDNDGRYELTLPGNVRPTLVFSFIGMKTQEVVAEGKTEINVSLQEDVAQMDEVVVTGYQTISKERATGAFEKLGTEKMEMKRLDNLSSVLEGEIAGYSDGIIRGVSTMNAQQTPLYVIDGFPVENTSINANGTVTENLPVLNMEDIESITVLKDAAAASIYGARAANGVIVITTKRAKEGKTQISASATWTIRPYHYYTGHLTDAADIIELQKKWAAENPELNNGLERALAEADNLRNNYAYPTKGIDILLDLYTQKISQAEADAQLNELASRGYAYYDDVKKYAKRNSFYQQYYLNVGKATEWNNFTFSVSYRNNKEEDIYTKNDQVGLNLQNSLQVTNWLKADLGVYVNFRNATEQTYNLMSNYSAGFAAMPYDRLVDEEGNPVTWVSQNPKTVRDNIENYSLYNVDIVPLKELGRLLEKDKDFTSRMFGKLDVKLFPRLSYNVMFQYEYGTSKMNRLEGMDSYKTRKLVNSFARNENGEVVYNLPVGDVFYTANQRSTAYNFRQQLNFDKTFKGIHNLTWILGQEVRNSKVEYDNQTRYGYNEDLLTSQYIDEAALTRGFTGLMNAWASIPKPWAKSELVNRFVSFYSNAAYAYNNRYTVSGSIRWDRSNLWGTNSKYQNKPLWSVGASWNIQNEAFFDASWVDMLKARFSYGIGGNIAKDAAPYLTASYSTSTLVGGLYGAVTSPPNPDLRWEKTTTINVGVDFSFFANRLSGSLEFYNKYSDDLLANQMGVPTEGFGGTTLTYNNGAMRNRGFELSLQGDVIKRAFNWNMGFLLSYNKNKVTRINVEAPAFYLLLGYPEQYPRKGNPYNAIYAYKWAGLSETGDLQIYDKDGNPTTTDYTDLESLHYAGTTVPVYCGSFTNVFTYKNFELSVQMLYKGGHKFTSTNRPTINMSSTSVSMTSKDIMNAWEKPGDENKTDVPRLLFGFSPDYFWDREFMYGGADIHVLNASNIKINNISLSYRLADAWVKKIGLSGAKFQFNVENVATIAFDRKVGYMLGSKNKPNYVLGLNLNF